MTQGVYSDIGLRPGLGRLRVVVPAVLRSRASALLLLVALPGPLYALVAYRAVTGNAYGSDFASFWHGGQQVAHGRSPYPLLDTLPAVADRITFTPFVYPPPAAFAMTPLGLLPFAVADTLFFVLSVASVLLALRLLDVRDWRCHAAAFASVPVFAGIADGAISPLLLLGVAAAWRYRDRLWRVAPLVAVLVVAKLFLWPLWLWLLYTRRYAAAALAAALGLAVTAVTWAAIGFAGLHEYPRLLGRLSELVGTKSYSLYALGRSGGASPTAAQAGVFLAGAFLAVAAVRVSRAGRTDERAFLAALGIALLLTPILWPHYLVLVFVPIALMRRTFSPVWLLPLLFWLDGAGWSYGNAALIAPFLAISALPIVLALRAAE